jgi:hypothetical protein
MIILSFNLLEHLTDDLEVMMSNEKDVVDFTPLGNKEYLERIARAKESGPPVGGAPMPKMPRLDQPPTGDRHTGVQGSPGGRLSANKVLTPEQMAALERDNRFIPGVGSAYAENQPKLPDSSPVVNPPRTERGLSPETVAGLEGLAASQVKKPTEETIAKEFTQETDDFGGLGQRTRSLLDNRKRREAIEKRITDTINIEDLITYQEFRQVVPIVPGKFTPTYRSVGGHEDLWVKRQMGSETGSDTYIMDKYAMMNLCCGLYALNGQPFLTHLDKDGLVSEDLFNKKLNALLKYPVNLLADLSVNYVWFLRRVEQALVIDDVKGF